MTHEERYQMVLETAEKVFAEFVAELDGPIGYDEVLIMGNARDLSTNRNFVVHWFHLEEGSPMALMYEGMVEVREALKEMQESEEG